MMKIVENEKNFFIVKTKEYDDVIEILDMYKIVRIYNKKKIDHNNIEGCFCDYKEDKNKSNKKYIFDKYECENEGKILYDEFYNGNECHGYGYEYDYYCKKCFNKTRIVGTNSIFLCDYSCVYIECLTEIFKNKKKLIIRCDIVVINKKMDDEIESIVIKYDVFNNKINLHYLSDNLKELKLGGIEYDKFNSKLLKLPKKLEKLIIVFTVDTYSDFLVKIRNKIKNLPFNTKLYFEVRMGRNDFKKIIKLENVKEIDEFINGKKYNKLENI
jgi:hypothetical protein